MLLAAAAGLAAPRAAAMGRVLSEDGSARVAELRVAVASSKQRLSVWSAFRIQGNPGQVGLVLPVAAGSWVDPVGDAWLAALDAATAPRIVPPGAPPGACGSASRVDDTTASGPGSRLQPTAIADLASIDEVGPWATSHALSVSAADAARLGASGTRFVGLLYTLPQGGGVTAALRVVSPGADVGLPLALPADTGHRVPVVFFAVTDGPATLSPGQEQDPAAVDPLWAWHDGTSDYADRSASYLEQATTLTWLVEARGANLLSSYSLLPQQAGAIPPVIDTYFKRVAPGQASQCVSAAAAARKLGWPVAGACPPGALMRVPDASGADPACAEAPAAGQTDAATLRCDGADDLAVALSGLSPDRASVVRLRGLLVAADPDPALVVSSAPDTTPVIPAKRVDAYGCGVSGSGGSGGAPGASGGSGGFTGASQGGDTGNGYGGGSDPYATDSSTQVNVNVGCSGDSSSSNGCSGDSSSSSNSDGSSCSGNSSSSSGDGNTCSGNSSSSSSDGSTCSGDSSSSSGDGSTCSGDSSSSSGDGSTCSGDSSSSSSSCSGSSAGDGSTCSLSHRRARPRASVLLLALAALAFPLRRRGARRRAHP